MKGLALPLGGVLFFLFQIVLIAVIVAGPGNPTQLSISLANTKSDLISLEYEIEITKKNIGEGLDFIGRTQAYRLGKSGGGVDMWNQTYPTIGFLTEILEGEIEDSFTELQFNGSNPRRSIKFEERDFEIFVCPNSECFETKGWMEFRIDDVNLNTEAKINATFERRTASTYFRLLNIGRMIMENTDYNTLFHNPIGLQAKLSNDFPGFGFEIVQNGNLLNVKIEDLCRDYFCKSPLSNSKAYDSLKLEFNTVIPVLT